MHLLFLLFCAHLCATAGSSSGQLTTTPRRRLPATTGLSSVAEERETRHDSGNTVTTSERRRSAPPRLNGMTGTKPVSSSSSECASICSFCSIASLQTNLPSNRATTPLSRAYFGTPRYLNSDTKQGYDSRRRNALRAPWNSSSQPITDSGSNSGSRSGSNRPHSRNNRRGEDEDSHSKQSLRFFIGSSSEDENSGKVSENDPFQTPHQRLDSSGNPRVPLPPFNSGDPRIQFRRKLQAQRRHEASAFGQRLSYSDEAWTDEEQDSKPNAEVAEQQHSEPNVNVAEHGEEKIGEHDAYVGEHVDEQNGARDVPIGAEDEERP